MITLIRYIWHRMQGEHLRAEWLDDTFAQYDGYVR